VRLIATDLDGTLLNAEHEVSKENIKAIRQAQEQGIEVVVATGRTYFDASFICKKFGLDTYLISYNGAAIHRKDGQQLLSLTMDRNDVQNMIKWLEEKNIIMKFLRIRKFICLLTLRTYCTKKQRS
jgi:HAD superfamily hydrolase (TIGR01484 family)